MIDTNGAGQQHSDHSRMYLVVEATLVCIVCIVLSILFKFPAQGLQMSNSSGIELVLYMAPNK